MNEPVPTGRQPIWTTLRPVHSECENLRRALAKLAEDDPEFRVDDEDTDGQIVIRAMSDIHLKLICERLLREHGIDVESGALKILYLETIRRTSFAEGKFIRQTGGSGNYGHAKIRLEPNPAKGYEFVNEIVSGAVPKEYIKPVDHGIREALQCGVLAGYEVVDVKATLYDGSYHEVDSNEMAFKIAGSLAFRDAATKANPILLEPMMSIEVVVPELYIGMMIRDLNSRRGRIEGMEHRAGSQVVKAIAPLAEIIGYANDLRSMTGGQASYSARFANHEQAPGLPPGGDDSVGVTANTPWKPKPKRGSEAAEPPLDG